MPLHAMDYPCPIPYSSTLSKTVINALLKYVKHNLRIPFESQFLEPLLVTITLLVLIDHREGAWGIAYYFLSPQETDGILKLV